MPAWITSLLRELVPVPKLDADSTTSTSRPAMASARATARPTAPAPTTTASAASRGAPAANRARPRRRQVADKRCSGSITVGQPWSGGTSDSVSLARLCGRSPEEGLCLTVSSHDPNNCALVKTIGLRIFFFCLLLKEDGDFSNQLIDVVLNIHRF